MSRPAISPLKGISPHAVRIIVTVVVLIVACAGSAGLAGWKLWCDARTAAARDAQNLGIVLAEQTARALQGASLVLRETQADLDSQGVTTPAAFYEALSAQTVYLEMIRHMKDLPQVSTLGTIDADGRMISFSRGWPSPPLSVADRDYFAYCQANHTGDFFISRPVLSRADGARVFFLAHCIGSPDGALLGVLLASLKVDYFLDFYRSFTLPYGSDIAIVRDDGVELVRYPETADAGSDGPVDEAPHVAIKLRTSYPLTVRVGVADAFSMARWRQQMVWIVLGSLCAMGCALIPLIKLMTVIGPLETAQRKLNERNSALRDSETLLATQSAMLETTLAHMDQGLIMVTADREVAVCNRRAIELLDLPPALMQSRPTIDAVLAYQWQTEEFAFTPPEIKEFVRRAAIDEAPRIYERQRPNGSFIEFRSMPLAGGGMVRTYTDITQRKQAELRLSYVADHDPLTGLANRRVLYTILDEVIARTGAPEGEIDGRAEIAVLYLDLDRFKMVNDTRGHAVGDQLLIQVARRMQSCMRTGDLVARLGGDEFAVVLPEIADREAAVVFAERLKAEVSAPYALGGEPCRVGVSIGVALHPGDGTTADELVRSADSALYRAKASGRNVVCCHDIAAEQADHTRLLLEQDLPFALASEQFELVYQPIFDVVTGLPHSFETLLRWAHPRMGMLSPDLFIPIAEETGLINEIGRWVIATACTEAATWALPVRVAINLSSVQFGQADLEQQVVDALAVSGLPAGRLDLEVTESVLIRDSAQVRRTMEGLQRRGVRLVMDDFGTGHSSLKTLQGYPFQQIKIDRAFVADMHDATGGGAIVRAMMTLAATMKLEVVAEGVETSVQMESLRALGCQYMQGFLLQLPQTPQWTRDYLWRCSKTGGDRSLIDQFMAGAL